MRPGFINKLPIAGPILSRMIETNVTTPFLGCPFSCSFCSISSFPKENRKFTARSPEDFVNELLAKQKNGANFKNRFYFISPDNLLVGGKKLDGILDYMIDSPLNINLHGTNQYRHRRRRKTAGKTQTVRRLTFLYRSGISGYKKSRNNREKYRFKN